MAPGSTWQLIFLIILIFASAFFSSSETALMSLSKLKIRHMVSENRKGAKRIEKLSEDPSKLLGTILVGNNIANIASSSIATALIMNSLGPKYLPLATIIMTIVVLIFGEITPKTLAAQSSEKVSILVAPLINFLSIIFNPIVVITTYIANILIRLLGGKPDAEKPIITEDELKTIVDVSEEEGILELEEREIIKNVVEFGDLFVKDIMVQRIDIVSLSINSSYEDVINIIRAEQLSRIPIYNESIDDIVGILNIKDILISDYKPGDSLEPYIREPIYTYEYKKTLDLFKEMNKNRHHMVVVLDEYGGTAGLITIEDILEEIVGEIEDEYDDEEIHIEQLSQNEYIVDGSIRLEDINDLVGLNLESDDFDSIGGFIINQLGSFPVLGEEIVYEDRKFTIHEVDKNRIKKVKITIL
ncbi:Hemolysin, contains CBS domains [Clostridium collagenovorans DSM 3089]|uniref:Hemolysin, contains CBS domains n=1 Tax=Clostridium collagenovorans DSM 3089 TaxID=1121306 RepID=A0A1M5W9C3_9CLOT|nr:hemolysin family protein [Clostridium collagenovorans]SHH83784.1 Hemolysin, contains CBS domains [Clostridium collagenovorans DSM 3089]